MKSGTMRAVLMVGAAMFFAACGDGGGGGGGGTPPVAAPLSGVFIDSPVVGLGYSAAPSGLVGKTDATGRFQYMPSDTMTYNIGGRTVGVSVPGAPVITSLQVFGATSITDARVVNLAQLLLTLGLGGISIGQNPIQLPAAIPAGLPNPLDFADPNFDTVIQAALQSAGLTLVNDAQATTHLQLSFKTLSVTIVNSGTVTSNPAGINCTAGTCSSAFTTGSVVTLTATGTGFTGWTGGGCSGTGSCVVTLNADAAATATFPVAPPPATLTISTVGTGTGTVNCGVGEGAFGACASSYPNGTVLVLQGVANSGSTFADWSNGTGNIGCTGTANCAVTLTANSSVTATFTLSVTNFSVTANPASTTSGSGTIQSSANGGGPIQCDAVTGACGSYPVSAAMVLTATPNSVSNFTGWSGAGCSGTGTCAFRLTANTTVTANFNRPTLTVQVAGTGGSVSSSPAGINACTTNCAALFNKGLVTLTASGAGFTGWSGGGCSGTAPCPVTLNTDTTVTANFGQVTTSARWLFYTDNAGTIRYADPANPGATTTSLTTTGFAANNVFTGTWDSTNAAYRNLTTPYLTYFSGGKLFRVFTAKSSGVPGSVSNLPVQISSETAATTVCEINHVVNLTVNNTKLLYELPGGDNNCLTKNDNVTRSVVVSDNATTLPTSPLAPGLVVDSGGQGPGAVIDLSTGLATHILLLDAANSNTLKLMNVTTNAITTIQANVGDVDFLVQDTSDRVFLHGGATRNILYLYTVSTNSLVPLVTGASSLKHGRLVGDGTNLYVAEQATGKLYKVPMNATGPSDVVTLLASVGFPLGGIAGGNDAVVVTTNNVFLQTYVPCSGGCTPPNEALDASGLYRVSKAGGAATPIITHAVGTGIFNVRSAGSLLYYNHKFAPTIPRANIINENGTPVFSSPTTCPGGCAGWQGVINSPTFFVRTSDQPLSKVILTAFANATQNGATLSAFDAPTGMQGAVLGIVPATTPTLRSLFGDDFIDTVTLLIGQQNGSPNNFLFFVDTVLAGSLTQVLTGTAAPWFPADF